jgi:conjugative transfer signal peptidase TraF
MKKIFCILGVISFLLVLYGYVSIPLPRVLIYNHTESIPIGWYLILPTHNYEVGDIVAFSAPKEAQKMALARKWIREDDVMLKKIGALEGTKYVIDKNLQFYVDGNYIGPVYQADGEGRPMPVIRGEHIVKTGTFLPVTKNPSSFDGRYYGAVPLSEIEFKVVPILVRFYF